MAINPRLYQKITGRMPGEAMHRYGEELARRQPRGRDADPSLLGSLTSGRRFVRHAVRLGITAAIVAAYFLLGGRWI